MNHFLKESTRVVATGVAVVVFGVLVAVAAQPTFKEPSAAFPNGNVYSPINVSDQGQQKTGSLSVGGVLTGWNSSFFALLSNQTVGVGTTSTAPGFIMNVNGKTQGSDFCLRGGGKCLSDGINVTQLMQPFPDVPPRQFPGAPAATISTLEWQECFFQTDTNGNGGAFGPSGFVTGRGTCHAKQVSNPDTTASGDTWILMASCGAGGKVISGGGAYYPASTNVIPGSLRGSKPESRSMYESRTTRNSREYQSGAWANTPSGAPFRYDGWAVMGRNSGGYDGLYAGALCGY